MWIIDHEQPSWFFFFILFALLFIRLYRVSVGSVKLLLPMNWTLYGNSCIWKTSSEFICNLAGITLLYIRPEFKIYEITEKKCVISILLHPFGVANEPHGKRSSIARFGWAMESQCKCVYVCMKIWKRVVKKHLMVFYERVLCLLLHYYKTFISFLASHTKRSGL